MQIVRDLIQYAKSQPLAVGVVVIITAVLLVAIA